jgi:hypothetical protein
MARIAARTEEGTFFAGRKKRRLGLQSFPEWQGLSQILLGHGAQKRMFLHQHVRRAAFLEALTIAAKYFLADGRSLDVEGRIGIRGEKGADGQPHQVVGEGHRMGLVEIVHAPDEAAFAVAPRSEIFQVKIAHDPGGGGARQVGALLEPELAPAVVGGAKKEKGIGPHLAVLVRQIFRHQLDRLAQPRFELSRGLIDSHSGSSLSPEMAGEKISVEERNPKPKDRI